MTWDDFSKRKSVKDAPPADPIDDTLATAFSSEAGLNALIWLRERTKERVLPHGAPESALRELEGQRHLVHEIELRIARGRGDNDRDTRRRHAEHTRPSARKSGKPGYARRLVRKLLGR